MRLITTYCVIIIVVVGVGVGVVRVVVTVAVTGVIVAVNMEVIVKSSSMGYISLSLFLSLLTVVCVVFDCMQAVVSQIFFSASNRPMQTLLSNVIRFEVFEARRRKKQAVMVQTK